MSCSVFARPSECVPGPAILGFHLRVAVDGLAQGWLTARFFVDQLLVHEPGILSFVSLQSVHLAKDIVGCDEGVFC